MYVAKRKHRDEFSVMCNQGDGCALAGSFSVKLSFRLPRSQNHDWMCPSGSLPPFFTRIMGFRNCAPTNL